MSSVKIGKPHGLTCACMKCKSAFVLLFWIPLGFVLFCFEDQIVIALKD